jgi:hypothetical protein
MKTKQFYAFFFSFLFVLILSTGNDEKKNRGRKKGRLNRASYGRSSCSSTYYFMSCLFLNKKNKMSRIITCRSSNIMGRGGKNWDPPLLVDDEEQQKQPSMTTTSSPIVIRNENDKKQYTWNEIRRHSDRKDRWVVIDKHVYDVTRWTKHPGGQIVLSHYAGQDATVKKIRT